MEVSDDVLTIKELMKLNAEERDMVRNGLPDEVHNLEEEIIRLTNNIDKKSDIEDEKSNK